MLKQRQQGLRRGKMILFIHPALQYLIERSALDAGYIRTGKFQGKPDYNGYLEDYLRQAFGFDRYTNQQINQMTEYQNQVNASRGKV